MTRQEMIDDCVHLIMASSAGTYMAENAMKSSKDYLYYDNDVFLDIYEKYCLLVQHYSGIPDEYTERRILDDAIIEVCK